MAPEKQGKISPSGKARSEAPPKALADLARRVAACRRCPRLVTYREEVARLKRRAYMDWDYWGRPVPGFGDPEAPLLLIGLAPAAHGGNRTGRVFTGDRSGDWLFRALHRAGLANQPTSSHREDGLELRGCYVTAAVRCAPPGNRPLPSEFTSCLQFLEEEHDRLRPRAILALGGIAFNVALHLLEERGATVARPRPRFAHLVRLELSPAFPVIVGSYHPSQQNTQTGRLTEEMLDAAVAMARDAAGP